MRGITPADDLDRSATYQLLNSLVAPRPIAWVSTIGADGVANIAPHSYFTVASVVPPTIAFTSVGEKGTLRNVQLNGEFVVSIVDHAHAEAMNMTAIDAPHGVSEFDLAELKMAASDTVEVPRVAGAPAALECRVDRIIEVGTEPSYLVLGVVSRVHLAERIIDDRDRIDVSALDAIARLGGSGYCTTRDRFTMRRPAWAADDTHPRSTT